MARTRIIRATALSEAVFILALFGCAGPQINWNDPAAISAAIRTEHDQFKKLTTVEGPNCAANPREDTVLLRAVIGQEETRYLIYIADEYTYEIMRSGLGWRFYTQGFDSDGNSLPTLQIARTVNWCGRYNCSYLEIVGLQVTRDYLAERQNRGLTVKISGKGGENIFSVPPTYIQAFLSAVK